MTSEVTFRRATLSDRQGVLDIDPFLFDGLDYMPSMYTQILQNPAYRAYVAETSSGEIVSFMALMIDAEEGFCGVLSGRTKKSFQSRGLIQRLAMHSISNMNAEFGRIFERLHLASDKPVYSQQFMADAERILVMRHAFLVYIAPRGRVVKTVEACSTDPRVTAVNIQELSPDRANQVFSDSYTLQYVLRKSHLTAFCNCLPLPRSQKYLQRIASQCKVFASFKNDSATKPNGISWSSIIKGPVHTNVNIYVSVYEHINVLLAHLMKHFDHVAKVVAPDATLAFRIDFPPEMDKEVIKDILNPTLGVNRVGKVHPMEYVLLWKDAEIKSNL